jgi:hypothetical protein
MRLRWEPKTPRTSYLVIAVGSGPDAWRHYIELDAANNPLDLDE